MDLPSISPHPPAQVYFLHMSKEIIAETPEVHVPTLFGLPICVNLPAIVIVLLTTMILVKGTKEQDQTPR